MERKTTDVLKKIKRIYELTALIKKLPYELTNTKSY